MPSIEVTSLTKRFGQVVAVDDLSFSVTPGHVTGFLGPNGAGKTTTLRMLLGLVSPTYGNALVNGSRYADLKDPARTVGAVLEASGFHPGRTARNHLKILATEGGISKRRVPEVLELVGLTDDADRRAGGYSMGMRQRLELARAMLGEPEVLVLDEPANGLDPQGIAWLRSFLRWYASDGRIVLVSSHLLAEAAQTVDEVVILARGRLASQGKLQDLLQGVTASVRVRTSESDKLLQALTTSGIKARPEPPDFVVADGASAVAVGQVVADKQIVIYEMTSSGESLEDLFFSLTEGAGEGGHLGWGQPQGQTPHGPPEPVGGPPVDPSRARMPPPPPAGTSPPPPSPPPPSPPPEGARG